MKKIVLFYFLAFLLYCCTTSNDINKNNFSSSTISISNTKKFLGMIGKNIETNNSSVATGVIIRNKIRITSVGEGVALLFVSNNLAEIAIINIVVSQTGVISVYNIIKYIDQPSKTILTGTTWIYSHDNITETIKFISGTKGVYTISESSKKSYSMNFSYSISGNEISLIFTFNGIISTTGTITGNIMTLLSIDDDRNQIYVEYKKTNTH